ncbi:hypothetical protein KAJ02_12115, partial [Candidatus Bipolaricaulota bacterium]|nr:hypothetical protein [Candidatus Bipolaricaulota bacterium]
MLIQTQLVVAPHVQSIYGSTLSVPKSKRLQLTDVRNLVFAIGLLSTDHAHAIVGGSKEVCQMFTITITSGMLLAFFWAFWIFA